MDKRHVVIIGGGITGLVAAYRLRQMNHDNHLLNCTLLEEDSRFGGKIDTRRTEDFTLELGPDSIYTRKPAGIEFIRELGLEEQIVPVSPSSGTFVWHNGHLQPLPPGVNTGVPSDMTAFAKTKLLSTQGKIRALADLILPLVPLEGDIAIGEFLRKRLGDEVVDVIASPLLAGIHAGDIDRLSLDATMPMWRKIYEDHRSLILGAMAMKKKAQSAPSAPSDPLFINLQNGLEQLVEHLIQAIKHDVDMHLNTSATKVTKNTDGTYEITMNHKGTISTIKADAIIVATPSFAAADILSSLDLNLEPLRSIRYADTATVSFGYKGIPSSFQMAGSGYLVPRNEGTRITACTIVSNKWKNSSKNGNLLVRCYVGRDGDEEAVHWTDERLIETTQQDLKKSIDLYEKPYFIEIKRWQRSMPQYDAGHLERVQIMESELQKYPEIILAGAAYRGIGIPDCIKEATRAIDRIKSLFALNG